MNDLTTLPTSKIGTVIITFNPDDGFGENLAAITSQVDDVVIVDNGSEKNSLHRINECISQYSNIVFIKNDTNLGIAKALNIGCSYLLERDNLYALLLDQDSLVTDGMVESLFKTIAQYNSCAVASPKIIAKDSDNNLGVIPSRYMLPSNSLFYRKSLIKSEPLKVLFNITSGSLIDLATWNEIGQFQEDYFIEGVDNEYGLRVNRLGYSIIVDNNASLVQQYGDQQVKTLFGRNFFPTFHRPLRPYYVSRNRIMIWKKYYKEYPSYLTWDLLSFFNTLFLIIVFEDKKYQKIKYIGKGLVDGCKGIKGKYNA
jgi:rhamnosyltransferase